MRHGSSRNQQLLDQPSQACSILGCRWVAMRMIPLDSLCTNVSSGLACDEAAAKSIYGPLFTPSGSNEATSPQRCSTSVSDGCISYACR